MAVETSAGNTVGDINFDVNRRGDECLTCGARARSVVTMEAVVRGSSGRQRERVVLAMWDRGGVGTNCGWLSPADLAVEREESGRGAECVIELRTHGREQQEGDGDRTREGESSQTDVSVSRVCREYG